MTINVRRVVTGQTPNGESVFTHMEEVEPIRKSSGLEWFGVWGWDETPELPYFNTAPYEPRSVFPAANRDSLRINTIVFPAGYGVVPHDAEPKSLDAGNQAADAAYAKLDAAQASGTVRQDGGMHATDSVDIGLVMSGEIVLIQGDGSEQLLHPGDVLVQNGAVHAWQNRSDGPCMVCFVVLGTPRKEVFGQ